MTNSGNLIRTSGQELHIVRTFDASRTLVFEAWTNPDHMVHWMCPNDYTVRITEVEPRVGGAWRAEIVSSAGAEMWHSGVYREFTPPSRLVFTHTWSGDHPFPGMETLITIDLVERDGKTEMTFRQGRFDSQANCEDHSRGWSEAFDHLSTVVETD